VVGGTKNFSKFYFRDSSMEGSTYTAQVNPTPCPAFFALVMPTLLGTRVLSSRHRAAVLVGLSVVVADHTHEDFGTNRSPTLSPLRFSSPIFKLLSPVAVRMQNALCCHRCHVVST